jgi:sugar phosphate isomerase/epimerase
LGLDNDDGWKSSFIPYFPKTNKEAIKVLSEVGYDAVEWMLGRNFNTAAELKALTRETMNAGLEVANLMCSQDLVSGSESQRNERIKLIVDSIVAARDASLGMVNLYTGPAQWESGSVQLGRDITEGEAWGRVNDAFGKVVEAAEKNDVTITVEAAFEMLVHDYYTLREFLGNFDSKNLAVNMDPSHLVLYGNDIGWTVRQLGGKIRHVHVKDVAGSPGKVGQSFIFPLLGDGMVDWDGFFSALREVGYRGFLSIEFEAETYLKNIWDGDWTKAAAASKEQLEHLVRRGGASRAVRRIYGKQYPKEG